ncbi:MAG: alanine--tRNA ligase [Candidatus Neomarinimicrobiota bacterium]|nr:alanine--tRNA ligase [Candidatus Neomarinimicrobiota bacterium]
MDAKQVRADFIKFFQDKDHRFIRSSSVLPLDDPTLLFTNAGMNQFKPIFMGTDKPEYPRAVNTQKCIRVSGKHNDLEEVGADLYHHTFFEMLGNWSFGDYYKKEAITWSWELFTELWGLDKSRLWATVYEDDDEAHDLWLQETDIAAERVLRFGKEHNFWEMGDTGPCGPCSEIHYYVGNVIEDQGPSGVNNTDEYWELWNLVFIQYDRQGDGSLIDLPEKHVDTGAGLERIVTVLQNKSSNYDTDLFQPIIKGIEKITGSKYSKDKVSHHVIADHVRMLSFAIADGAMPANEGRGYVLRRILRRAARFGRLLGKEDPFLYQLVDCVIEIMGDSFPELIHKKSHIEKVIKAEESSFSITLERGLLHFEKYMETHAGDTIPGEEAFKLYDTYGFPLDLTQLMARERGLNVDEEGFHVNMNKQRDRAKASGKFKQVIHDLNWVSLTENGNSSFLGYGTTESTSKVFKYAVTEEHTILVLDQTPFYAEAGGQIGDTGSILIGNNNVTVLDTQMDGTEIYHYCAGLFDFNLLSDVVKCQVDIERRQKIKKNHTATHLLHAALKNILGEHVHQAGSLVHPDYLRFDMTHSEKISADEIVEIEKNVNNEIQKNIDLDVSIKDFDVARSEGAEALFGEKYGDKVRMITIGEFSKELCGGTHVDRTGDIGLFKIIDESSLAAGIRRLVAVTGSKAVSYVQNHANIVHNLQAVLGTKADDISSRVEQLINQKKELEKKIKRKKKTTTAFNPKTILEKSTMVADHNVVTAIVSANSTEELKEMGDVLLNALPSGIGVLGTDAGDKPFAVIVVTNDLIKQGIKAGYLAKIIGNEMDGGGGGKPHLATAGGKNSKSFKTAMKKSINLIKAELKKVKR